MEKLDTSDIDNWPKNVFLGTAEISDQGALDIFSKQDQKEYEGFTNLKRKAEYLSARQLFYFLLQDMKLHKNEVQLYKEQSGKPFAKYRDKTIHLSFSHSPNKVYCAVSLYYQLGLDVEQANRKVNDAVVQRILNEQEKKEVGDVEPIRLWTIKEATVKCIGTGLRTSLNDLTIIKKEKSRFSVRFNNEKLIEICSFRQSDHQIALAYQSKHI